MKYFLSGDDLNCFCLFVCLHVCLLAYFVLFVFFVGAGFIFVWFGNRGC